MIDDTLGLVGTTIAEKYDVVGVVGEGGFAVVYRAEHKLWKRPVALKVFKALADLPAAAREELTQNFIREGALLAELSEKSASICQARDVGVLTTSSGVAVPYMVLEWLEGESLEDALQREQTLGQPPRTLVETVRLLEPVADALALAHARGIAHRDVKPANMFLLGRARDERCPVKLLDFGIAKVVQDMQKAGGAFTKTSGTLTSFTPAYAAPEQFSRSHGPTGPWTDVFSLALVAVELLTGRAPLDGESFLQLGFASGDTKLRPTPRARGVPTSDAVEAVFLRALAVAHADRYPSAAAFWHDLRQAVGMGPASAFDTGPFSAQSSSVRSLVDATGKTAIASGPASASVATTTATTATGPASPPRSNVGAIVGACVAVGALLAFVGYRLSHGASPPPAPNDTKARPVAAASSAPTASSATPSASSSAPTAAAAAGSDKCPAGGPFFMGSDDGLPGERPEHKVQVAPYCMDTFEVTTARYIACSDVGWCKRAATTNLGEGLGVSDQNAYDQLCNERDPAGRAQHPINCVTWEMADVFCRSHHVRLPTEAEWEFAARGSDGRAYPWGDAPPSARQLNACGTECAAWGQKAKVEALAPMYEEDDHWPNTAPVGSFPEGKSKFGVMDLAGNVWEWVSDWYGPYAKGDGVNAVVGPTGPTKGTRRVIRGGAWNGSQASWERPSFRYSKEPTDRSHGIGFRCAAEPK
jgi:formylglycine-generating enzyme required for sulfatase activity